MSSTALAWSWIALTLILTAVAVWLAIREFRTLPRPTRRRDDLDAIADGLVEVDLERAHDDVNGHS